MKPRINDLEHNEEKNQPIRTTRKKKIQKAKDSVSSLWDNSKRSNICIIGVSEGEETEQETENLFEK